MEKEPNPTLVILDGESFTVTKPKRLNFGMVLKSNDRPAYARLGEKQATLEEQLHTISLGMRGFPVARVLGSGEHGNEWYFIEEDLGSVSFHDAFANEYERNGMVSDETFSKFLTVVGRYLTAQYHPTNRTTISPRDFVDAAFPEHEVTGNYYRLGGDVDRYRVAIDQAVARLEGCPMGVLQFDLNPYNIVERGVIDFEMVGYGPLGYDAYFVSRWHRWFTNDRTSKYRMAYSLSDNQIAASDTIVDLLAREHNMPPPAKYHQEFALIKTAWGFSSHASIDDEPESKQAFYRYRFELLRQSVDAYLAGQPIDPLTFPDVHAA